MRAGLKTCRKHSGWFRAARTRRGCVLTHICVPRAGQHLVSAIADEVLGADTASWELHSRSQDGDAAGTADEAISVELEAASVTAAQILVGIALTLEIPPHPTLPYHIVPYPSLPEAAVMTTLP